MKRLSVRSWRLLLICLAAVIVSAACQPSSTPGPSATGAPQSTRVVAPRVGALAPDFSVQMMSGETLRLSDLRGKPVMVNFWASWCPPCKEEAPFIQAASVEKRFQGVQIVAVNRQESREDITRFMSQNGYTFPVGLDPDLQIAQLYQVYAIPESFFISTDGVIRVKKAGAFFSLKELESSLSIIAG